MRLIFGVTSARKKGEKNQGSVTPNSFSFFYWIFSDAVYSFTFLAPLISAYSATATRCICLKINFASFDLDSKIIFWSSSTKHNVRQDMHYVYYKQNTIQKNNNKQYMCENTVRQIHTNMELGGISLQRQLRRNFQLCKKFFSFSTISTDGMSS